MKELLRTNNPVLASWLTAMLKAEGIELYMLDSHMSVLEGSANAIQRRFMVGDGDYERARGLVIDVGEGEWLA